MKRRTSVRREAALACWLVALCACNGHLAVVDSIDSQGDSSGLGPDDAGEDELPALPRGNLDAKCQCASSSALKPLICTGQVVPLMDQVVQTTRDGSLVVFYVDDPSPPDLPSTTSGMVAYWDGSHSRAVTYGIPLGLSATGQRLLISGASSQPGLTVLEPDSGRSTLLALDAVQGQGLLSASGEWVFGETYNGTTTQLARANADNGRVEVLGAIGVPWISTVLVTPDASTLIGHSSQSSFYNDLANGIHTPQYFSVTFRWLSEGGLNLALPNVPPDLELRPDAVNADGTVISGIAQPGGEQFRWSEADGFETLGFRASSAALLSADGSVMAGSVEGQPRARGSIFRWTRATGSIELTPGQPSLAKDMSDDGSVIVGHDWDEAAPYDADPKVTYIWDAEHGTRTLDAVLSERSIDAEGWRFSTLKALSGDGKVLLGSGYCGDVPTLYRLVLSD